MKNLVLLTSFFVLFILINVSRGVDASFFDGVPIISQIKSGIQAITGDEEGAEKTQENFMNQAPVISQVKSAVQFVTGDAEGALKTQEHFLHGTIEPVVDNTPVVGHLKGTIHLIAGDTERGEDIMKGASSSAAAVLGGIVGGPAGAIAAHVAADHAITAVDSALSNEFKPYGVVDYMANIDKKDVGEHFDTWMGIGSEIAGGKYASRKLQSPSSKAVTKYGNKRPLRQQVEIRRAPVEHGGKRNNFVWRRRMTDLPEEYSSQLTPDNFRNVDNVPQAQNTCYGCALAGETHKSLSEVLRTNIAGGALDMERILDLYNENGYTNARVVFKGQINRFEAYLKRKLRNNQHSEFILAYTVAGEAPIDGHVVNARVWKDSAGNLRLLTTDYSIHSVHNGRFSTNLPRNTLEINIISLDGELKVKNE